MGCQQPGEPHDEPSIWQLGASWSGFDTELIDLRGNGRTSLRQHAVTVSGTRLLPRGWSLRAAVGVPLAGSLGTELETLPGVQAAVQGAKLWRRAEGARPFVSSSLALAVGWSRLDDVDLESFSSGSLLATDARLGTAVGWEIAGLWSPYLSLQVFGGPVFIDVDGDVTQATDVHHYRGSLGSSFFIGDALSLFADVAPLGERGVAVGVAYASARSTSASVRRRRSSR